MKNKKLLCIVGALLILGMSLPVEAAAKKNVKRAAKTPPTPTTIAINKYKAGNYTGCIQDLETIVKKKPTAIACYYLAMAYANAGKKDEAIKFYTRTIELKPSAQIQEYAKAGRLCLEDSSMCDVKKLVKKDTPKSKPKPLPAQTIQKPSEELNELDKFIRAKNTVFSDSVKADVQLKRLESLRNQMNSRDDLNEYDFKDFKDYKEYKESVNLKKRSQAPTNEEIIAALEVLQKANYYQQSNNTVNYEMESPELAKIKALFGDTQEKQDSMLEMLPFALAQNKLTEQLQNNENITPEMVQNMLMNNYNLYK